MVLDFLELILFNGGQTEDAHLRAASRAGMFFHVPDLPGLAPATRTFPAMQFSITMSPEIAKKVYHRGAPRLGMFGMFPLMSLMF